MEPTLENLNKTAITNGVILGIITLVMNILVYYVSPSSMGSTSFGLGLLVVSIILYVVFIIDLRKKIGGFWTFKEALKGIFLMMLIAGLIDAVIKALFYKFIEPGAYEKISGYVVNNLTATYESMGMNQDKTDEIIEKVKESLKGQFDPTLGQFFKSFGIIVLVEFILSLIFAAIFKKNPPMFAATTDED